MRTKLLIAVLVTTALSGSLPNLARGQTISPGAKALYARLTAKIRPSLRTWIDAEVQKVRLNPKATDATVIADARAGIPTSGLAGGDIEAIAFIVMMEATQDANKDLKAIMDDARNSTKQTEKFRVVLHQVNADLAGSAIAPGVKFQPIGPRPASTLTKKGVTGVRTDKPDSTNDMSEMDSLQLQMMMDRRSKFVAALNNIMKKIDDTQDTIIQNLKG